MKSKLLPDRAISMPAAFASEARSSTCDGIGGGGVLIKVKASLAPAGVPAPHSPDPLPALAQVSVPFGVTVQPLAFSKLIASDTLNGYGLVAALDGRNGLLGNAGIGPYAGSPSPLK